VCVIAVKEPGTREAHLLEAVQEGVWLCICVCVFPVKEPGTREAHLLEAVQEGVWFCICVCVLYLCGCACVCLLKRSLARERRTCWRPCKRVCMQLSYEQPWSPGCPLLA
jgi:hypothetical protein